MQLMLQLVLRISLWCVLELLWMLLMHHLMWHHLHVLASLLKALLSGIMLRHWLVALQLLPLWCLLKLWHVLVLLWKQLLWCLLNLW